MNDFSDRTQQGFESPSRSQRVNNLSGSSVLKKWIKFYKEIFEININLEDVLQLNNLSPGATMILVAKEINEQVCLDMLESKVKELNYNLRSKEDVIFHDSRKKKSTYITYTGKYEYPTILELLLYDLFLIFQGKPVTQTILTRPFPKNKHIVHHTRGISSYIELDGVKYNLYLTVNIEKVWSKDSQGKETIPPEYKVEDLSYSLRFYKN